MTMRQTLTLREIIDAAEAALDNGTMAAQAGVGCIYQQGPFHCVIGTALTEETLQALQSHNDVHIGALSKDGLIKFDTKQTLNYACDLQKLHDGWAGPFSYKNVYLVGKKRYPPTEAGMREALRDLRATL